MNVYYAVCYKDKDGFIHNCVDEHGRVLICKDHHSALSSMSDHIDYLHRLLAGRPKYEIVPKKKFGIFKTTEIIRNGTEYDIPDFARDQVRCELYTIAIRKVRVL